MDWQRTFSRFSMETTWTPTWWPPMSSVSVRHKCVGSELWYAKVQTLRGFTVFPAGDFLLNIDLKVNSWRNQTIETDSNNVCSFVRTDHNTGATVWAKYFSFNLNGQVYSSYCIQIQDNKIWFLFTNIQYLNGIVVKLDFDGNIVDSVSLPAPFNQTSDVSFFFKPISL